MKITAVRGFPVKVGHRNQFVVKIETDAGLYGVGEGGISGRELAMLGMLASDELRLPLTPMTAANRARLRDALASAGLRPK